MSEYTDELLESVSDELTHKIDLYLSNTNLDHSQKLALMDIINAVYVEGASERTTGIQSQDTAFMKNFIKKLNGESEGDN